jgi:hypothetical protein
MPPVGFEPANPVSDRPQTHALDRPHLICYPKTYYEELRKAKKNSKEPRFKSGGVLKCEYDEDHSKMCVKLEEEE